MIPFYQVDAFTDTPLSGNPAAVMRLTEWLPNSMLQKIASENNLSETAFILQHGPDIELRWFTPQCEVKLCGHATLASAHILFSEDLVSWDTIHFHTRESGSLHVHRLENNTYKMDFPLDTVTPFNGSIANMEKALGCSILEMYQGKEDLLVIVENRETIEELEPDFFLLSNYAVRGIIVSCTDTDKRIYSRWFGPRCGVNEDPVTGSAHTTLAAHWCKTLNTQLLPATQLSKRQGNLSVELMGDRVELIGSAVTTIRGHYLL